MKLWPSTNLIANVLLVLLLQPYLLSKILAFDCPGCNVANFSCIAIFPALQLVQWPFHPQLRPLSTVPLCTVSKTIALLHKLLHCYRTYCTVTETIALCHSRGFRSLESYADHHHPGSSASTWQMCTRMHLHKHAARPPPYMKLHLSERGFTKTYKQIAQVPSPFCLMQNFTNPAFTVEWQWCTLQCIVHC